MSAPAAGLTAAQVEIGRMLRAALTTAGSGGPRLERRLRLYARRMRDRNRQREQAEAALIANRPTIRASGLSPRAYLARYGTDAERASYTEATRLGTQLVTRARLEHLLRGPA